MKLRLRHGLQHDRMKERQRAVRDRLTRYYIADKRGPDRGTQRAHNSQGRHGPARPSRIAIGLTPVRGYTLARRGANREFIVISN